MGTIPWPCSLSVWSLHILCFLLQSKDMSCDTSLQYTPRPWVQEEQYWNNVNSFKTWTIDLFNMKRTRTRKWYGNVEDYEMWKFALSFLLFQKLPVKQHSVGELFGAEKRGLLASLSVRCAAGHGFIPDGPVRCADGERPAGSSVWRLLWLLWRRE